MYLTENKFFNFKNKVIFITGSSGVIGRAICKAFLDNGSIIYGVDILNSNIKHKNYFHLKFNLNNEKKLKKTLSLIIKKNKKIDIIINAAAVSFFSHFEKRKKIELKKTINVNLMISLNIIKNYVHLHKIKKLKTCRIINFGSIYGSVSPNFHIYKKGDRFNSEIYGATKASIIQLTKYLGALYANKKIFINCISPGGTIDKTVKISKSFKSRYFSKVPIKRMANPDELITAIMYLASSYSTYTIGQNVIVDGGYTAW
jgi:NAD(P)-dependent dehydrogenase (short-subunit alcohol dehydrogenase family)